MTPPILEPTLIAVNKALPETMSPGDLHDSLMRPLHDLRISLTDECNFRCPYCMPVHERRSYPFLGRKEKLEEAEIIRIIRLFTVLGIRKVRITGGEPLLCNHLSSLIKKIRSINGLEDIALTTNGLLLNRYAQTLRDAGLNRLTVSLDTLDPQTFRYLNGNRADLVDVLDGIDTASHAGFFPIKINAVIQKGINDTQWIDLVKYCREKKHILRFIEYMDVGNCNNWSRDRVVPSYEMLLKIQDLFPAIPLEANYYGEVAERYRFQDGCGEIGFVSSVTQPFCGTCTRIRLSTDGHIYTCLFAEKGFDLKALLRNGMTDEQILKNLSEIWKRRDDCYSEQRILLQSQQQKRKKIEMYQIGG